MKRFVLLCGLIVWTSTAFPCISNLSVTQIEYTTITLHWTNGCPAGTVLWVRQLDDPIYPHTSVGNFVGAAEAGEADVGYSFLNTITLVDVSTVIAGPFVSVSSTIITTLARPPTLWSESSFTRVAPRSVVLQWDSKLSDTERRNPSWTNYEVQLSSSLSFSAPVTKIVSPKSLPLETSVGCLSPKTTYYARVRAINLAGIPTAFLFLGSTGTLPSDSPPLVYSWGSLQWGVSLSADSISDEDVMLFNETPLTSPLQSLELPEKILTANAKLQGEGDTRRRPLLNGVVEILTDHGCPSQLDAGLVRPVNLTCSFTPNGGLVDIGGGVVRENTLSFYRLDTEAGVWNKIPSRIDGDKLTASVKELGTLAVMGQEDVSLQDLRVSPNPFHQGSDANITFANLAERATLKIFTPSGREVRSLEETDGDGILLWDGKNSSGNSVEPGVYIYRVESPGAEKKGKVMVLR